MNRLDFPATQPLVPPSAGSQPTSLHDEVARLARDCRGLDGEDLLRALIGGELAGEIAVVSAFGAESVLVLDMVARIDPATPVLFLDTGKHFPQTLAYRDLLIAWLGLENVRSVTPGAERLAAADPGGVLWQHDPDHCCALRKAEPLERALTGYRAWVTGRKRYQGATRAALAAIEAADGRIKLNPLAFWSAEEVRAEIARRGLPPHPLVARGYPSIGCATCTAPARSASDARSGRWQGREKTECGIHRAPWYTAPADTSPAGAPS
jgi:phosphoadenosine phosphosulfate reductase